MTPFRSYLLALTAAFVVLDATGKVSWPWWWVVSPVLVGLALRGTAQFIQAALRANEKNKTEKAQARM